MSALARIVPLMLVFLFGTARGQVSSTPENEEDKFSIDTQISHHIHKLAEEEREKRMEFMRYVIEDIIRLCDLDEKQKAKLVLAAKGASKRSMESWHQQADRYFRTRVSGADADTAREILSNIGSVNFGGRGSDEKGEIEALWKDSLQNVLSESQIEFYNSVIESRARAEVEAFAGMAIAALDNYLRLTPDQRGKLTPIVQGSAAEYLEEIQRYWGNYLERNMLMSLVNAAEPEDLSAILTEKQFGKLRSATTNLDHFWEERRRIKKAKMEAEEKKRRGDDGKSGQSSAVPQPKKPHQQAEAAKIAGDGAGKVVIKAGAKGVVIQPGAIFRAGDIRIEGDDITVE